MWAENSSPIQKWHRDEGDFLYLWQLMAEKLQNEELDSMATIMRNIWLRRNIYVLEGRFKGPTELFIQAQESLSEFKQEHVDSSRERNGKTVERGETSWKIPKAGFVKINWDAALGLEKKRMRMGVVVRDEEGEVLVSLCKAREGIRNPTLAELYALWRALKLYAELNWAKAIFEGDAMVVIKYVNSSRSK